MSAALVVCRVCGEWERTPDHGGVCANCVAWLIKAIPLKTLEDASAAVATAPTASRSVVSAQAEPEHRASGVTGIDSMPGGGSEEPGASQRDENDRPKADGVVAKTSDVRDGSRDERRAHECAERDPAVDPGEVRDRAHSHLAGGATKPALLPPLAQSL